MGGVGHRWTVAFLIMADCIVAHIFSVEGGRKRPGRNARGTAAAELFPLPESAELTNNIHPMVMVLEGNYERDLQSQQ
jgi:hypothetical protein